MYICIYMYRYFIFMAYMYNDSAGVFRTMHDPMYMVSCFKRPFQLKGDQRVCLVTYSFVLCCSVL